MHGLDERRRRVARVRNGALLLGSRCAHALLEALGDDEDVVYVLNDCSTGVERFEVRTDRRDIVVRKLPLLRCRVTSRDLLGAVARSMHGRVARAVHGAKRTGTGRTSGTGTPPVDGPAGSGGAPHEADRRFEKKRGKHRKRGDR